MKQRRSYSTESGNRKRPQLSPERKAKQKEMASCYMVIRFQDNNVWSKWSNEHGEKKIKNISVAVNEMFRVFKEYFENRAVRAAIFDTRVHKTTGAHNKIYQYENGVWTIVQAFTW